jgi:hypothetical protein
VTVALKARKYVEVDVKHFLSGRLSVRQEEVDPLGSQG